MMEKASLLFSDSWWVFSGISHGICLYVIGRLLIYGYREHSYLYQIDNHSQAIENAISIALPFVRKIPLHSYRRHITTHLARSGIRRGWTSDHFIANQAIFTVFGFILSYVLLSLLLGLSFGFVILLSTLGLLFPYLQLKDRSERRYRACSISLPFFIDYLALAMSAGLDFTQALTRVVEDAPKSPLRDELNRVSKDMRMGASREQALADLQLRMESPGLKLFVQTLLQAIQMGSDVVQTLVVISETLQSKRFQAAEEAAGKISVRMMIPMMIFVLPATVIILLGPIMIEWIQNF